MNLLPAETNLDIIKCFNFNQLNNIQQSNRHFCNLINKYKNELAIKVFYSVELVVWKNYVCKHVEQEPGAMDFNLSEELKLKWNEAIQKRIRNYLFKNNYSRRKKFDVPIDSYKMNETANLFLVSKETDGTEPKLLRLKIQLYPETIQEMLVLRYWLERLSHCFIENFKIEQGLVNPDIIDLLFDGSPTFKLHTKCFYLFNPEIFYHDYYPRAYEFIYHNVVAHGSRGFYHETEGSVWKMRGEKIKEEERLFLRGEEEVPDFCKVVEYEFFGIDDPEEHVMMYMLFRIGSKEVYYLEVKRIDI
uniref:F-box domain-containing protein n=1 Tax=Meloidogyne hapla TaxID=6305 RepID=A0A1I8B663_MELHA